MIIKIIQDKRDKKMFIKIIHDEKIETASKMIELKNELYKKIIL